MLFCGSLRSLALGRDDGECKAVEAASRLNLVKDSAWVKKKHFTHPTGLFVIIRAAGAAALLFFFVLTICWR